MLARIQPTDPAAPHLTPSACPKPPHSQLAQAISRPLHSTPPHYTAHLNSLTTVSFTALELTRTGTFISTPYTYTRTPSGINIYRGTTNPAANTPPTLSLNGQYRILKCVSCGICSTDLARQYLPYELPQVIGHEAVVEVPPDESLGRDDTIPDLAVIEINDSHIAHEDPTTTPTPCPYCTNNLPTQCPSRITMGINTLPGGLAPFVIAPLHNIVRIPRSITNGTNSGGLSTPALSVKIAALVEPFAAALHAAES
ncbi:hypothetical protein HK102_009320, partial [Quaeritorhiza haematococci]